MLEWQSILSFSGLENIISNIYKRFNTTFVYLYFVPSHILTIILIVQVPASEENLWLAAAAVADADNAIVLHLLNV